MREPHILIVGAGPVGLTCAALLAQEGVRCTVLEREPSQVNDLRASTFHPPTLDMLAQLDLAEPLIAQGRITPSWQIRWHETGEFVEFDLSVLAPDTAHPYRLQCEQTKLVALHHARLSENEAVDIIMGAKATALSQTEDAVTLSYEKGGETHQISGDYLIGCDGGRSFVRQAINQPLLGETYPETTILATTRFPFERHFDDLSHVAYFWARFGNFALLHLPDRWRVSLHLEESETEEEAQSAESLNRKLQRLVPSDTPYEVLERRPYRIHRRIVENYFSGRVALAGDAAHLNSPTGGMGMNGGLHDAFNLAPRLAAMAKGEAGAEQLALYQAQRRPVAEQEILAQADANRKRMRERDPEKRRQIFNDLKAIESDPARLRAHLLRSSMIDGLRKAAEIAA